MKYINADYYVYKKQSYPLLKIFMTSVIYAFRTTRGF